MSLGWGAFGGGSRPPDAWAPGRSTWSPSSVGGHAAARVAEAGEALGRSHHEGIQHEARGYDSEHFQGQQAHTQGQAVVGQPETGDSIRFFAIGDWGNPSRRLKKVARVM